jgi:Hydantoinase/oxoprolinase N-terminal region
MYLIGVDVGGTFTDLVAVEESRTALEKAATTPDDPSIGGADGVTHGRRQAVPKSAALARSNSRFDGKYSEMSLRRRDLLVKTIRHINGLQVNSRDAYKREF